MEIDRERLYYALKDCFDESYWEKYDFETIANRGVEFNDEIGRASCRERV